VPASVVTEVSAEDAFLPVSSSVLRRGTFVPFDLHLKLVSGQADVHQYMLYRRSGLPFTDEVRTDIERSALNTLYVSPDQASSYREYVEGNLGDVLRDESIELPERAGILYSSVQSAVEDLYSDPRSGDLVQRGTAIVHNTCDFLFRQEFALRHLMRVTSYDYYTYTHSVNVFVFSMCLAQRVLPQDDALFDFGFGSLFHDIGKSEIDPAIVNCKSRLSPEQFETMKLHPVFGHEILLGHGGVGEVGLDVARHHHEKLQGQGYPDGLRGEEVSIYARIAAIADIFDALTTRRSYKEAMDPYNALKLMNEKMANDLDAALFRAFVKMVGEQRPRDEAPHPQPPGGDGATVCRGA